ncbi:MAG: ABC transporter substrate-binding protein [Treponema sp.]|nr:ABC transporter substrate-binding protein [Treponema sp.]
MKTTMFGTKRRSRAAGAGLLLLSLTILPVLAGCNGTGPTEGQELLRVIASAGPRSLDPAQARDTPSVVIMRQIYDTLLDVDPDTMEVVPALAESWAFETDAQGRHTLLRMYLKRGVKFHNGDDFTAADVKFTLDRAKASPHLTNMVEAVSRTEIVDDYQVLIVLDFPFAPLLNNLALPLMGITGERAVTEAGDAYAQHPIGTGPMKFVNWIVGSQIELTRWDGYYGPAPKIKDIVIRFIPDAATALLEMETGGADMLLNVQPQDIRRIDAMDGLQIFRTKDLSLYAIGMNFLRPPFDDIRVRKAILHAVDRDAIVKTVYQGVGSVGRGPLPEKVWASAADILPQYEYDPEKSRQLLAEAGFPDGFTTNVYTNDSAPRIDTVVILQDMLARVGITLDVRILEWTTFLDVTNRGEHDLYTNGWVTVSGDPDYGLEIFHSRAWGDPGNRAFYSRPEVDRLLDLGRMEVDPVRREQLYIDAQKLIHEDAPWIYILDGEQVVATGDKLRGFNINPTGYHTLSTVWFAD